MSDEISSEVNYDHTGMNTAQAFAHGAAHLEKQCYEEFIRRGYSRLRAKLLAKAQAKLGSYQMTIGCDGGCGATIVISKPAGTEGVYRGTSWMSMHNLDFCFSCLNNGNAKAALRSDVVPHDPRTFGGQDILDN